MDHLIKKVVDTKIIAIVRKIDQIYMKELFQALLDGGIELAEVTMNTEGALNTISTMKEYFDSRMVIGAGTVLDCEMAEKAIDAGASFIVSPNLDRDVITYALSHNVLPLPGVMTPSEVVQAVKYGAPIVKLFPSSSLGPGYIKELMGPLNGVKLVAVGGVNKDNAREFIKAGAIGLGIGGNLVNKKAIEEGNFKSIVEYAKQLREAVTI